MFRFSKSLALTVFFVFTSFCLFAETKQESSHYVLVSVSPHRFFVKKIAGNTLDVGLMVPAGASAHTYDPTPKQMIAASNADIWFRIGENFEDKAIRALRQQTPKMRIVDLRENLDLISDPTHICMHHKGCMDLHFWLSPKLAKTQAETIAKALIELYPENADLYKQNLQQFQKELDDLDQEIAHGLTNLKSRTIMVSHPAYGYFARDYGLNQFSIEFEGKDPTPQQLTRILNEARKQNIQTVFIQPQYSSKGAKLIAEQIKARVVTLDPYSEDFYTTLRNITKSISDQ